MKIVLFDDNPSTLLPFTYLRPSWDVNVGGITLREWVAAQWPDAEILLKPGAYRAEGLPVPHAALNGRLLPSPALASAMEKMIAGGKSVRAQAGNELAFCFHAGKGEASQETIPHDIHLLAAPWQIIEHLDATLALAADIGRRGLTEVRPGVFAGAGVEIPEFVVSRTARGPVIIGKGTTLGSFIVLEGPLLIGERCMVRDQAVLVRAAIGNVCKVGGEVEDAVIHAYSNKQHAGYLGHSMVGSWANLGAGTTTSDLKHTYGLVRADRGAGKEETGMQFCGSFLGDGVKTAINTTLMSGSVIGLNAFVFGLVKGFVPSFASFTSQGLVEMPLEVAMKMRERMMARRGIAFSGEVRHAFEALYARTVIEREAHQVKKGTLTI